MKKKITTIAIILFAALPALSQKVIRNYSFEDIDALYRPIGWSPQSSDKKYSFVLDTSVAKAGKISIRITLQPNTVPDKNIGLCNTILLNSFFKDNHKITISAYVKTDGLTIGGASIWMQLNGSRSIISDKNSDKNASRGTTEWTKHTIELPLTDEVVSVGFGCKMSGNGKAWFDDFEVRIDEDLIK
ncbi:hypothetical protein ACLOAU_21390 [Niabella sp. CJ426]|uniref:hypothetical protein n=1 Tax=Niabella sp. CJ426 TaxID=3393740 RepID=UPI003CFE50C8